MPEPINELAAALAQAQGSIRPAEKDGTNPHFRNHYATLASVWDACRKPLADNGLSVVQLPEPLEGGGIALRTVLLHSSGQTLSSLLPLTGDLRNPQAIGSALTYARRYALAAMVGVVADDDDDGNAAAAGGPGFGRDAAAFGAAHRPAPRREPGSDDGRQVEPEARVPRSGRALFAWTKDQEARHGVGLLAYLNKWGKLSEFPSRMVDWTEEQVGLAFQEAVRKINAQAPTDPAEVDALA